MPSLASPKVNLTKPYIEALEPKDHSYLVHDSVQRGLCIKVRPTGSKSFLLYKSIEGRPKKLKIGPWPEVNVVAARQRAVTMLADMAQGRVKRKPVAPTLGELGDLYTDHLKAKGSRCPKYVADAIRLSWEAYRNRKIDDITSVEVQEVHNAIA